MSLTKLVRMASNCQGKDDGLGVHGHFAAHVKVAMAQRCNATKDIRAMARTTIRGSDDSRQRSRPLALPTRAGFIERFAPAREKSCDETLLVRRLDRERRQRHRHR